MRWHVGHRLLYVPGHILVHNSHISSVKHDALEQALFKSPHLFNLDIKTIVIVCFRDLKSKIEPLFPNLSLLFLSLH